jgi:hypothetical protein
VLGENITAGGQIFNLAALVVFRSVIAHGRTDTPGVDWIARRGERSERPPAPGRVSRAAKGP